MPPRQAQLSSARKKIGTSAERLVEALNEACARAGVAHLHPGDSGLRPVAPPDGSGYVRCRAVRKGSIDFEGTLRGGRSVLVEVKHTGEKSWPLGDLQEHQALLLDHHHRLGALCLVVVVGPGDAVFALPWPVVAAARAEHARGGRASIAAAQLILHRCDLRRPYLAPFAEGTP